MTAVPGDQAKASVAVALPPAEAFRIFTEEIDLWWRRGPAYRIGGKHRSVIALEPRLGGRLFESFATGTGPKVIQTGAVTTWDPPHRLVLEWRAVNFRPEEKTEVEVLFEPTTRGTLVTVIHRGWAAIRPDHPARHGQDVPAFVRTIGLWWGSLLTALRLHVAPGD